MKNMIPIFAIILAAIVFGIAVYDTITHIEEIIKISGIIMLVLIGAAFLHSKISRNQ